ncbi:hypothetical protein F5148DRAFT_200384 [Russula earlei]|uniref:Uncharacterized protein n=1 Tax=Russula earlei TaxID=71964 RepID=A0ACC0U6J6_9AGAM|nr:hypothetical protein F5148DRAFT_200384 [Russula earlei]
MPEPSLPCTARSSTTIGDPGPSQASFEESPCEHRQDQGMINTLPDEVLVDIFHFYVNHSSIRTNEWHTLVHVCQRWRSVVFVSPRRLDLRLEYSGKSPISEMQDVWPDLPVVINLARSPWIVSKSYWENLTAALESEHHRICEIHFPLVPTSEWERLAAAMQKPFPELTFLRFWVDHNTAASLPNSFLGGSAPLLRELLLRNCPLPGIPKLLLSANQLVLLRLWDIPDSGYLSPQDLGTALSVMSRLESLYLGFKSRLYPATRPPPSLPRSVLPNLTFLTFCGVHAYLEDLLVQIEAPRLRYIDIVFFMDLHFVLPELHQLISQVEWFKACDRAIVRASHDAIQFSIFRVTNHFPKLSLEISCRELVGQLSSLAQVCSSFFPLLSNLVQLEIMDDVSRRTNDMEITRWLELLDPFIAVKDLCLSRQVMPHVCQALEEIGEERVTDVLPALQDIFLKVLEPLEFVPKCIERFVAARKLSGHPVAVHRWR